MSTHQSDVEVRIAEMKRKADAGFPEIFQHTARLPYEVGMRLLEQCRMDGAKPGEMITAAIDAYFKGLDRGVVALLPADVFLQLDDAAAGLGLQRDELVRMMIAEHLNEYLVRAVELTKKRKGTHAELRGEAKSKR